MSEEEFEAVLDASDILRQLVYGGKGMSIESKFDICRRFDVPAKDFNMIRACIRLKGHLPTDDISQGLARSGRLRHSADVLGGFNFVYAALEEFGKSQCRTALSDMTGEYQWKILPEGRMESKDFIQKNGELQNQD